MPSSSKKQDEDNVFSLEDYKEFKNLKTILNNQLEQVRVLRNQLTDQMITSSRIDMTRDHD